MLIGSVGEVDIGRCWLSFEVFALSYCGSLSPYISEYLYTREILRCAQNDSRCAVILSAAKNLSSLLEKRWFECLTQFPHSKYTHHNKQEDKSV